MRLRDEERGQVLILVVVSMVLILALAAFAIDVAGWYQQRHQAQVSADSAALAAANCLARVGDSANSCTVQNDVADAQGQATTYANANNVPITTMSVDTTAKTVAVTTAVAAPVAFAGIGGLHPTVSAHATASWVQGTVPISMFAGNNSCASGTGISLSYGDGGGGGTNITGLETNGLYTNNMNSSNASVTGEYASNSTGTAPYCSGSSAVTTSGSAPYGGSPNTTLTSDGTYSNSSTNFLNWPSPYAPPTCDHTATYWTTHAVSGHQITGAGVWCATGTASTCDGSSPSTSAQGTIYLDASETGVELYASCVELTGNAGGSTAPSNAPLVYATGTSNSIDSVVIDNSGSTFTGAIFAPGECTVGSPASALELDDGYTTTGPPPTTTLSGCNAGSMVGGIVDFTGNNDVTTFVEAQTVKVKHNNFKITGNGPDQVTGTDALTG